MDNHYDCKNALVFRLNDHGQGPELIRQALLELGWVEFDEDEQEPYDWNLWWKTSRFRTSDHENLMPWQRLNHYPKSTAITKKDALARNLKRMKGVYGSASYNFSPNAFNLPNDYTKFVAEYSKMKEKYPEKLIWICKPADLSRGRGIFVFKELGELQYDCNAVVQQYITNPLLISGYKFDLRIYVLVSSFHPLNIYIYQEGLVRFSTEKYDLTSLKNMYSHLTNTSINKNSPAYAVDKERIGPGCKWTLTQLRHYFHSVGIDDAPMFAKVINIIILTLLIQIQQVPKVNNCFELYGFDIIFDENLKPWLLEVNFSPALSTDCQTDFVVKKPLLHDLFELLHFRDEDKQRGGEDYKEIRAQNSNLYPNFGVRKSSLGSNNNNRRIGPLQKRGSSNRLPSIQGQSGNNNAKGSPRSVLSTDHDIGFNEQEEDGSDTRVPDSKQTTVPTLVAGCGLPSVQLPKSRGRPLGEDSGCVSPNDLEDTKDDYRGLVNGDEDPEQQKNLTVNRDNRTVNARNDPELHLGSSSDGFQSKGFAEGAQYSSRLIKAPGLLHQTPNKMVSKHSMNSDSGISSYSGSSENSHLQSQLPLEEGYSMKSLSYSHKLENNKRLNHFSYRDSTANEHHLENNGAIGTNGLESLKHMPKFDAAFNSKFDAMTKGKVSQENGGLKPVSPQFPKYRTNRKGERLSKLSWEFRNPRKSLMAHATASQTQVVSKPTAALSYSQMSNYTPDQVASKSSVREKRSSYDKPWRRTTKPTKELEKSSSPRPTPMNPLKIVGDFHLVFPFNETCKRTTDPKVLIKECHKFMRQRITKAADKKKESKQTSRNESPNEMLGSAKSSRLGSDFTSASSMSNFGAASKDSYPNSGRISKISGSRTTRSSSLVSCRSPSKTLLNGSTSSLNSLSSAEQSAKFAQPSRNIFAKEPAELWAPVKSLPQGSG